MNDRLYIDGLDAYLHYGVYVTSGGYNEVIAYPPLKSVTCNDWQEEDGVEADLSSPVLNAHEVQIKFAFHKIEEFSRFLECLSDGAYHTFKCAYIGRIYKLRLTQQPNMDIIRLLGTATLKFSDDFPLSGYTYDEPKSDIVPADDYYIDDVPFTDYGCRILKGSLAEVTKAAQVKQNLLRNITTKTGVIYDPMNVTYKAKDVKLYCLMRAETLKELWRNYDALLYNLIRPEARILTVSELCQGFGFYYKSCSITDFYPDEKIWLAFTLTLTLISNIRLDSANILASEDYIIVSSEDGKNMFEVNVAEVPDIVLISEDGLIIFTEDNKYAFSIREKEEPIPALVTEDAKTIFTEDWKNEIGIIVKSI